jgi:hypothetical protein
VKRLLALLLTTVTPLLAAAEGSFVLSDFEKDTDKSYESPPAVTIVADHAKGGTHALKVTSAKEGYSGLRFESPAVLRHFGEFPLFRVDIFNPQDNPVVFSASAGDAKSVNYGTRYNNDGYVARPGWSTLQINLTGLTRSNSNNFSEQVSLDSKQLKFFTIFLSPAEKAQSLYFDNARLEGDGLPQVEGLRAFDFGPSKSAVYAGFEGVNETTIYTDQRGFGWQHPGRHGRPGNPDDLSGDYGSGDAFIVNVKTPGKYIVNICIDTFGEWQSTPWFDHRTLALNGKTVLDEHMDADAFIKKQYLRFEDDEDTPGMDLWEQRVKKALPVRTFEADVGADGKLDVRCKTDNGWPGLITFLTAYPKTKEKEGTAYMAALDKVRHDAFSNETILHVPKPDGSAPQAKPADETHGFISFVRCTELDVNCSSVPSDAERTAELAVAACPGERTALQLGIFPLKAAPAAKFSVTELAGPGGAKIPASSVVLRKERNFAKRAGRSNTAELLPYILQPLDAVPLNPGFTRGIWVTVTIPSDAAAGDYTGSIKIEGGASPASIPLKVTVLPFKLNPVDDITISSTGSTAGHWLVNADLNDRWWKIADDVMRDQAEHGMNAVTGGPGMTLTSITDGKADIDFTATDHWLALANKHGLTRAGDSYQGLDVNLWRTQKKEGLTENDKHAKESFGVSFPDLIKIVYGTIEGHAKEKQWPPRSYALLDEPRTEFGDIESARILTELHIKNAPNSKFSGYYSGGEGRDEYFKIMPISIAHHTEETLKLCKDNGKEAWTYDGGGQRCDIGRWMYVAQSKGLSGFLRNGYQYTNSDPYYDFSDSEGSWAQVYPAKDGIADTIGWERTAEGVKDFRYLKTLRSKIDAARRAGKLTAEADAAEAFLTNTLKPIKIDDSGTANLKPEDWAKFRSELISHIVTLSK